MKRWLLALCLLAAVPLHSYAQNPEISRVRGDLYRVQVGEHSTVFLVTGEGIILGDPLTRATAQWLRQELSRRFPSAPVKYVLVTHHHLDRAEGIGQFEGQAEIIGQERFEAALEGSRRKSPAAYRYASNVETRFKDQYSISLGGKRVELFHVPSQHAEEMTVLYFPDERALFGADSIPADVPPLLDPSDIFRWSRIVSTIGFDIYLEGRGEQQTTMELSARRDYLLALVNAVDAGYEAGESVATIQSGAALDSYRNTPFFASRAAQIADVYEHLRPLTVEIGGAAAWRGSDLNPAFCAGPLTTCAGRGTLSFASASLAMARRRLGVVAELTVGGQFEAVRTTFASDQVLARRESRISILLRHGSSPRTTSLAFAGGFTAIVAHTRRVETQKISWDSAPRVVPFETWRTTYAATGGVDFTLRVTREVSLVAPVRVSYGFTSDTPLDRVDIQSGIGLSIRIRRRIG